MDSIYYIIFKLDTNGNQHPWYRINYNYLILTRAKKSVRGTTGPVGSAVGSFCIPWLNGRAMGNYLVLLTNCLICLVVLSYLKFMESLGESLYILALEL